MTAPTDRANFFATVRSSLFAGRLNQAQVKGMDTILAECAVRSVTDKGQMAYLLATAFHETAQTMQPIKEWGGASYFRNMYDIKGSRPKVAKELGNLTPGDGAKYFGRGHVMITGKRNYAYWSKILGVDLVANPDLALKPEHSTRILVEGSKLGTFTGRKLADYISGDKRDFKGARRIINGTDKAALISGYAEMFFAAL